MVSPKRFVYILKSKRVDWYYIGMTTDPERRLLEHNRGKARATRGYRPFDMVLVEEFPDRLAARRREKYYKTGFGRKVWMKKIREKEDKG